MSDNVNFESLLKQLEDTVRSLESDLPLDEAIKAFEKGIELSKQCVESLKTQKGKLALLIDDVNNLQEQLKLD